MDLPLKSKLSPSLNVSELDSFPRTPKTPKSLSKNSSAWSNHNDDAVIETTIQFPKDLSFEARLSLPKLDNFSHDKTFRPYSSVSSALRARARGEDRKLEWSSSSHLGGSELDNNQRAQTTQGFHRRVNLLASTTSMLKESNSDDDVPKRSQTAPAGSQRRKIQEPLSVRFRKALEVPPYVRTDEQNATLLEGLREMEAFKDIQDTYTGLQIVRILSTEKLPPSYTMFKQGDKGSHWFIIYKGKVSCTTNVTDEVGNAKQETVVLTKGQGFGEPDSAFSSIRTCTVQTLDAVELLRIDVQEYHRKMKETYLERLEDCIKTLQKFHVFESLKYPRLRYIAEIIEYRSVQAHDVVYSKENKKADAIYFIKKGRCKVLREVEFVEPVNNPCALLIQQSTGEQLKKLLKVINLEAGQFFGDVELLSGATHTHREFTVVGTSDMELLVLKKEEFFNRITPGILQMFREQVVHKYPTDNEIIDAFLDEQKNKRWATYKTRLVENVINTRAMERSRLTNFASLLYKTSQITTTTSFSTTASYRKKKLQENAQHTAKPPWRN